MVNFKEKRVPTFRKCVAEPHILCPIFYGHLNLFGRNPHFELEKYSLKT